MTVATRTYPTRAVHVCHHGGAISKGYITGGVHVPSAAFPYQNRHQTMEKYLRDVHDAGRRPSALPQVGRRGNLVW